MCANWILFANHGVVGMQLLESMLTKLVDEFENRLTTQNDLVCSVSFAHCLPLVSEILLLFYMVTYGNI
jgi:hypothetical protein